MHLSISSLITLNSRVTAINHLGVKGDQQIQRIIKPLTLLKYRLMNWRCFSLFLLPITTIQIGGIQVDKSFTNPHKTTCLLVSYQHFNYWLAWNSWYHSIVCAKTSIALSMSSSWLYIVTNADTCSYLEDDTKKLMTPGRQAYDKYWNKEYKDRILLWCLEQNIFKLVLRWLCKDAMTSAAYIMGQLLLPEVLLFLVI